MIDTMTLADLRELLARDGYPVEHARAVQRAATIGALLWTRDRLTTTDSSRIDERPVRS